jgi:hypothetical protein
MGLKMFDKIISYIKKKYNESMERQRRLEEMRLSVTCPYCNKLYNNKDVNQEQRDTGLENKDFKMITCGNCNNEFIVKRECIHSEIGGPTCRRDSYKLSLEDKNGQ